MKKRSVLVPALFLLLLGPWSAAAGQPLSQVAGEALESVSLEAEMDLGLTFLLSALREERNVVPQGAEAFRVLSAPGVVLIPLERSDRPEAHLFLYYLPEKQESFFLQIEPDPIAGPAVRLWSRGASEILITQEGAVLLAEPSEATFRVGPRSVTETSVIDTLACIARTLGLSLNTTTLQNLLSSATCSATSTMALALTAFSCLNPTPIGILACTVGIAKIVSCSFANCNDLPPSSCQGPIELGQRVNGSWDSSCEAEHRSDRYAKYYTFTLSSTTSVQIDLEALLTDPYLILLSGDGPSGSVLRSDNNSGFGWNARIVRTLSPGTYTIEATTSSSRRTGSFSLSLSRR